LDRGRSCSNASNGRETSTAPASSMSWPTFSLTATSWRRSWAIGCFFLVNWSKTNQSDAERRDVLKGIGGLATLLVVLTVVLPVGARETPVPPTGPNKEGGGLATSSGGGQRLENQQQQAEDRIKRRVDRA